MCPCSCLVPPDRLQLEGGIPVLTAVRCVSAGGPLPFPLRLTAAGPCHPASPGLSPFHPLLQCQPKLSTQDDIPRNRAHLHTSSQAWPPTGKLLGPHVPSFHPLLAARQPPRQLVCPYSPPWVLFQTHFTLGGDNRFTVPSPSLS